MIGWSVAIGVLLASGLAVEPGDAGLSSASMVPAKADAGPSPDAGVALALPPGPANLLSPPAVTPARRCSLGPDRAWSVIEGSNKGSYYKLRKEDGRYVF